MNGVALRWSASALLVVAMGAGVACSSSSPDATREAKAGQLLLEQYDCGRCHVIPGVRRAEGILGPTLQGFARQAYIAGEIPHDRARLVQWIQAPRALVPDTLMPTQDMPARHAEQMAAYLATLR